MPWKLIVALVIAVLVAFFIGFNLQNSCSVSFGFATIDSVPVYLTAMFSFIAGMLLVLPFVLVAGRKRVRKAKEKAREKEKGQGGKPADPPDGSEPAPGPDGERPSGLFASMRKKSAPRG